jgi:hypothetical protein
MITGSTVKSKSYAVIIVPATSRTATFLEVLVRFTGNRLKRTFRVNAFNKKFDGSHVIATDFYRLKWDGLKFDFFKIRLNHLRLCRIQAARDHL